MARSVKKGPFVQDALMLKVQILNSKNEKRVVAKSKVQMGGTREIVVICGYDLLTNNQVSHFPPAPFKL